MICFQTYYFHEHITYQFLEFLFTGSPKGVADEHDDQQEGQRAKRRRREEDSDDQEELQDLPQDLLEQLQSDDALRALYKRHWNKIKDSCRKGKLRDTYNFRLLSLDSEYITKKLVDLFEQQTHAFKINASYGFVLRNNETGDLKYHYASSNTRVLTAPFLIHNRLELMTFLKEFLAQDPLEYARLQRPNSKWVVQLVPNLTLYLYKIPNHPIGAHVIQLPNYILENRAIVSLANDPNNKGKSYQDNLCFFRCVALHQGCHRMGFEKKTKELFNFYLPEGNSNDFSGVTLAEMAKLEEVYGVNIVVYRLIVENLDPSKNNDLDSGNDKGGLDQYAIGSTVGSEQLEEGEEEGEPNKDSIVVAHLVRRSLDRYAETMYLNLHENHFSFITNIDKYCKSYMCRKCQKLWKSGWALT